MADERYNRWQSLAIGQLSVAVALVSGLAVAGLGAGVSLIQDHDFKLLGSFRHAFIASMVLLMLSALTSCGAVITRTLDFRLTARKVRKAKHQDYRKSLTIFGLGPDGYGRATWGFFWFGCVALLLGAMLFVISVAGGYWDRWIPSAPPTTSAPTTSTGTPKPVDPGKPSADPVPTGKR